MPGNAADDLVDAAQLLAVLDADLPGGSHSAEDPRVQATQAAIDALFARAFPLTRALPSGQGPALGRSRGDRYFGCGAWYPPTLAAAGLRFRLASTPTQAPDAMLRRCAGVLATPP